MEVDAWLRAAVAASIRNKVQSPEEARSFAMALEAMRLEEFLKSPEGRIATALIVASGRDIFLGRDADADTIYLLSVDGLVARKGMGQQATARRITPEEAVEAAVKYGKLSPTAVFSTVVDDLNATADRIHQRDLL